MSKIKSILVVLITVAAVTATARQLYKSVGPDGKITFSDRPSADAEARVSVLKSSVLQQVEGAPPPGADTGMLKKTDLAPGALPPPVVNAIVALMSREELVRESEELCSKIVPRSAPRFVAAARAWRLRNVALIEQQNRVLASLVPDRRVAMHDEAAGKVQQMMAPVVAANVGAKVAWCDQTFDYVNRGYHDVVNRPGLAGPLMGYRPK